MVFARQSNESLRNSFPTKKEYEEFKKKMPKDVDWYALLSQYEFSDMTEGAQELACVAGGCEI